MQRFSSVFHVAAALLCIGVAASMKLPSYITTCAHDEPDLHACMKKNAALAIPEIVKGDRKYRIPPLEPFFISEMALEQESRPGSPGYSLVLTNATLTGLSKVVLEDIRGDIDKRELELVMVFPHLELITTYKLSGQFMHFPIKGDGPGNITMTDVKVDCKFNFEEEKKVDGLTHLVPIAPKLEFEVGGRLHLQLDNLLNGDKVIGDNMNAVLNDNWKEVAKIASPGVAEVLGALLKQTLSGLFELVPLEEIFV